MERPMGSRKAKGQDETRRGETVVELVQRYFKVPQSTVGAGVRSVRR